MSTLPSAAAFSSQLAFWAPRGVICAVPSFWFAATTGYNTAPEIAGMCAAVATFVFALAGMTAFPRYRSWMGETAFGRRLQLATTLRTGWAVCGILAICLEFFLARSVYVFALILIMPDFYAGVLSVGCVELLASIFHQAGGVESNSFGWTYLTTLLQGMWIALTLFVLAVGLTVISWIRRPRSIHN
jgi:hypothetical protein